MLKLNVAALKQRISASSGIRTVGKLHSARGVLTARIDASVGELCQIHRVVGEPVLAEVIGFEGPYAQLMCFHEPEGLSNGLDVEALGRSVRVPTGPALLGRVLDGLAEPIDGGSPVRAPRKRATLGRPPAAMTRPPVSEVFATGQRVIDGLLTFGKGQRVGLFAGSGVGKSTLLGEIARYASSDVNVIVLVGERGREVRPFLDDCLKEQGLARSVVFVATSDETPLMRLRAVTSALAVADDFRAAGANVLFLLDSLTRLATAQREIGLQRGEPPGARGYPPSAMQLLASVLERLGNSDKGSITGILTVLVDGDDHNEPVADAARSILDGHVVLTRKLAQRGHFPSVDVLKSVSRVFNEVCPPAHIEAAMKVRALLSAYEEAYDLIQIGAYTTGANPQVDRAIQLLPAVHAYLCQRCGTPTAVEDARAALLQLGQAWPFGVG
jgi:flagellum-specific ATP synthase